MSETLIGVSVCLSGERGLVTPRETIRLVERRDGVRLLGLAGADHTAAMRHWADTTMGELCKQDFSGFVLSARRSRSTLRSSTCPHTQAV